jgi:sugar (pentulose or hexulose) kinase
MSTIAGYLGIDNGTQGLSVILTDEDLHVIATGEGTYNFVEGLAEGCFEQHCEDWEKALRTAMEALRQKLSPAEITVLSIGISGQMHGEVLVDQGGEPVKSVRLWCDARNDEEGHELTEIFGAKVPKRATAARFLWTVRNQPDQAMQTAHLTTPAGWLAFRLTGEFVLGIGDAAGMFPIDATTRDYDLEKLAKFDSLVSNAAIPPLGSILPKVRRAGEDAGSLTENGAALLGLSQIGIPVAAAEGDQVAALAGSLIGKAGTVSCCFGTSVCANAVGDRSFHGVSPAVDHFCAADGKPINMVWLRNGTTFLNTIVESYGGLLSDDTKKDAFATVMPQLVEAPADCGGLLAMPFMHDEPGLEVTQGGSALIVGWNPENAKVGNVVKAALISTMFNLRLGCAVLDQQGYPRTELVLTGGLSKTPECGQILADVFDVPVTLLASADEGSSWGAAVLAKYRYLRATDSTYTSDWPEFLDSISTEGRKKRFKPDSVAVAVYNKMFERYWRLIELQPQLTKAVAP